MLAIQGDFEAHARALVALGCDPLEVRRPEQLDGLDGLVIPGGESTTIEKGLDAYGLGQPIRSFAAEGRPLLGTCAGLIVLDRNHLGVIDIEARRNAFGRQVHSFEAPLEIDGVEGGPLSAVFIRAPWIEHWGSHVQVLASVDGHAVAARQQNVLVVAFHPELTGDLRLHELFLSIVGDSVRREDGRDGVATRAGMLR